MKYKHEPHKTSPSILLFNINQIMQQQDNEISALKAEKDNYYKSYQMYMERALNAESEVERLKETIAIGIKDNPCFGDYSKSAMNFHDAWHEARAEVERLTMELAETRRAEMEAIATIVRYRDELEEAKENQTCVACDDFHGWKASAETAEKELAEAKHTIERLVSEASNTPGLLKELVDAKEELSRYEGAVEIETSIGKTMTGTALLEILTSKLNKLIGQRVRVLVMAVEGK